MPASAMRYSCASPAWTGLRVLTAALLAACCASAAAFGVGTPQLLSGYAEPLRVRVPVILDPGETRSADSLRAELVPASDYARYGVAEQAIDVGAIHALSRSSDSATWIEIGSVAPMREPAAILLLRVRLNGTTIVREVPLLFEPAAAPPAAPTASAAEHPAAPAAPDPAATPARPPRAQVRKAHRPHGIEAALAQTAAASPAAPTYSSASTGLRLAERFDSLAGGQPGHR